MMLVGPLRMVFNPPTAIVPVVVMLIPIAIVGPFGMVLMDPIRVVLIPP